MLGKGSMLMDANELKILRTAILHETEGEKYYRNAAKKAQDPETAQSFLYLAEDERQHEQILRSCLAQLQKGVDISTDLTALQEAASPRIFTGKNAPHYFEGMEISVFHIAVSMEKHSIDFYRDAASKSTSPGAKCLYDFLVNLETGHLEALENIYDMLSEDWWDKQSFSPA